MSRILINPYFPIDTAKGAVNKAIGKAKVALGKQIDNPEMIVSATKWQIKVKA